MVILDFGCSTNKVDGALGVDIDHRNRPDLVFDLNRFPYPIKDNSVDRVYAKHILEHLGDLYGIFREVHRVLRNGGDFIIEVPHFSCRVAYSEPEHNRFFSYFMFDKLIQSIPCKVAKREITFHRLFRQVGIKFLANRFPDTYERFWTYIFPAENIKVELKIAKG
jgi:SAM-dependent methyltransferase